MKNIKNAKNKLFHITYNIMVNLFAFNDLVKQPLTCIDKKLGSNRDKILFSVLSREASR